MTEGCEMEFSVRRSGPGNIANLLASICISVLTIVIGSHISCGTAQALTATLGWAASTSTGVAGYKVYSGRSSGKYDQVISAGNRTTAAISNLLVGQQYYFAITAHDAQGNESPFSKELVYTMNDVSVIPIRC